MNFANYLLEGKKNNNKKIFINKNITYSNLFKAVNENIKNSFFKKKNQLIALCFENSEEFLIVYLTIIKSGNIAVVLEQGLSEKRYLQILNKFKINYLITKKKFDYSAFSRNNSKIFIKNNIFFYDRKIKKKLKYSNQLKQVAVILFTSGSTGEKKGVMLTHLNLIFNTSSILKTLPIKRNDIVNLILPTSYSFGLSIVNTHIKVGAKIFLHTSPFIGSVIKELNYFNCTSFYGVPSSFEILLSKTNFINQKFPTLKYLAQAGGRLDANLKKKMSTKFKNKLYIMYGATEASPRLSYVPSNMLDKKINSIGIPIPGVKFKLFKFLNTKYYQLGAAGKNIMKGYLEEPKLTKKIIKDNFFLTGDLAYKDKDNYFFLLKRIDKVIKRFGYKINLDLIMSEILKIKYIPDCKLLIDNEKKLVLIAQIKNNKISNIKKLIIKKLKERFASYEYPEKIIVTKKNLRVFNKKLSLEEILKITT